MNRLKAYKKLHDALQKSLKVLENHENLKDIYITQRIERLIRIVGKMFITNERNWDLVIMISRPAVEISLNIINLLALGQNYVDFLDKESEHENLKSNRDYLNGYITSEDVYSRKKFIGDFQNNVMDKLLHNELNLHAIRTDSSKMLHDNQCSYDRKPTAANIDYVENIIFFLLTQIYKGLCSQYEVKLKSKKRKKLDKLEIKSKKIMKDYKIFKGKEMKILIKILRS